jgi:hypothetical protein
MFRKGFSDIWEIGIGEHVLIVHGSYSPGCPSHWSDWDGGYPAEPDCIEIEKVYLARWDSKNKKIGKKSREIHEGKDTEAWDKLLSNLEERILESISEE